MVLMFVMINLGVDSLAETKATLESGREIAEIKLSPKKTGMPEGKKRTDGGGGFTTPFSPRRPAIDIRGSRIPRRKSYLFGGFCILRRATTQAKARTRKQASSGLTNRLPSAHPPFIIDEIGMGCEF
ncbi:hypothetical protein F4803DRAFT_499072 [Xylaria telfairii]|nr:hypothetical protein F4803DRAFT_499072 [Xylaria telfairii]